MAKQSHHLRSLKTASTTNKSRAILFVFQTSLFIIEAYTLVLLLCAIILVSMHSLTRPGTMSYCPHGYRI